MPDGYDTRRIVLDAGRTALALRALHQPAAHYPFVDEAAGRRRRSLPRHGATLGAWRRLLEWRLGGRRSAVAT